MIPTSSSSPRSSAETPPTPPDGAPSDEGAPLAPIGPERLAQLREAIRKGTYPTESDVVGGLVRLFDERK